MVIKFVCPNGHPLSAGEELAGKPGKCPKCQSMFLVPEAPAAEGDAAASSSGIGKSPETISFLCPNGHKLSGPRALQGKAGQCPHCGSKFRIPNYDEPEEAAGKSRFKTKDDEIPVGEIVEGPADGDAKEIQDVEVLDDDDEIVDDVELDESDLMPPPPPPPENIHPLALLCLRFWRTGNGKIEVIYGENQTLTADRFSPELSQWDCGVFAHRGETGAYTVTAIPWSSIRRLSFPGIEKLPEVFE
jgi:hypothetical protein